MSKNLSEREIDELVIAQADQDGAWETPIFVNRKKAFTLMAESGLKPKRTPVPKKNGSSIRRTSLVKR